MIGLYRVAFGVSCPLQLFFQPVSLHLQLPDLLIQLGWQGVVVLRPLFTACREQGGNRLFELLFPVRDLCGMHPLCTG